MPARPRAGQRERALTRRSIRAGGGYVLLGLIAGSWLVHGGRRAGWAVLAGAGACLAFFRDPERRLNPEPDLVYASADGVVLRTEQAGEPWMSESAVRVSTFLSLHNVHVTRSPVSGRVARAEAVDGGLAPALLARAESNRRLRLAIDGDRGRVVLVQVAGSVARRITSWVEPGSGVAAGERVGLIHFGSRADVVLPSDRVDLLVRPGDRVRAGVTPLARYRGKEASPCASS